jgi:cytochrome c-type biogenesis protein CcmH/NrfG
MVTEQALKQWAQLEKHARLVSQRYPADAEALVFLARANRHLGNDKAAAQAYEKVLELIPDHVEARQNLE